MYILLTIWSPGVLKMRPRPASTSVLEKRPASMTEATEIVSTPVSVTTPIRTHGVTAVTAQRRKRRAPEADAEESALFQKWLASDIAKNEKKIKLMQLQEEKTKLQVSKLQRELQLE